MRICQEIVGRKIDKQRKCLVFEKNRVILGNYTPKTLFLAVLNASITFYPLTCNIFFANISVLNVNDNGNDSGNVIRDISGCSSKISPVKIANALYKKPSKHCRRILPERRVNV
jgi:hypothetical protein